MFFLVKVAAVTIQKKKIISTFGNAKTPCTEYIVCYTGRTILY